jgi:cytochrome P450
VLDELLRHRDHLDVFTPSADDVPGTTERQRQLVLEALRVHPPTSFVARVLASELSLVHDGRPVRRVGAGVVAVFTGSADVDRARWSHPLRFEPSRFAPRADGSRPPHPYAFSSGLHLCPGIDLAPELILRVLRPLLRTADLRRAPGSAGRLSCQLARWQPMRDAGRWPLPTSLTVTYRDEVPAFVPVAGGAPASAVG